MKDNAILKLTKIAISARTLYRNISTDLGSRMMWASHTRQTA